VFHSYIFRAVLILPSLSLIAGPASADHPTVVVGEGTAGPIVTVGGTTLPAGMFAVSFRWEYIDLARSTDEELLEIAEIDDGVHSTDSLSVPSPAFGYGITDRLTLGLRQPYLYRRNVREVPHHDEAGEHHEEEEGEEEEEHHEEPLEVVNAGSPRGRSDLVAAMQFRLAGPADGTSALSLVAGLEMPTGSTKQMTSHGERFETDHQPGSGSWDPLVGLAGSKGFGRSSLHGNVIFQLNNEGAQATTLGDATLFNLAFVHRFGGAAENHPHAPDYGEHTHNETAWDGIIELNGDHRGRDETAGVVNENSGGSLLYLAPGLRVRFAGKWSIYTHLALPIVDEPNGFQHKTDYRVLVGMGVGF
jgi:hypothetical protein